MVTRFENGLKFKKDNKVRRDVKMKKIKVSPDQGLTLSQVQYRIRNRLVNYDTAIPTKSVKQIIKDNLLTLFNLLNLLLAISLLCVGSFKNMLFLGVVFSNVIIGTYQEINAKRTIDKLSIISASKVHAMRNGTKQEIHINEVVLDDVICLERGNQIAADSVVVEGECFVNESLITGESDSIKKKVGDTLLSGSYVVSGRCKSQVIHIGEENYAAKISKDAKYIKKVNSEIMSTFKKIILIVSILIVPIGTFLFAKQIKVSGATTKSATEKTVAALVGMIPEGLVLLTSSVLAVSVIRLAKRKVMVQELYCIETLARVDTLCLDKTGTITEGTMEFHDIIPWGKNNSEDIEKALSIFTSVLEDSNPTHDAIRQKFTPASISDTILTTVPFSSETKWSGISLKNYGSLIIGAAEFILPESELRLIREKLHAISKENRVLTVIRSSEAIKSETLPKTLEVIGFVLLKDKIRTNAKDTLNYFKEQGVDLKIISGDNTLTVASIARRAGLDNADKCVDATTLKTDEEIYKAAEKYAVFGRVSPVQKKKIICALKAQGHTVAMTGDGVNDVLALKEADCSVAMAAGSDAARNVSQLVLLNSDFSSMVKVVQEGRRSINNIQRSSSLFLVKTIYSTVLAIIFLFVSMQYPFMPIQLTLTSVLTIGIPSFVLALEPNHERVRGHFFVNILNKALPGAITIISNIIIIMTLKDVFQIPQNGASTLSVLLTGFSGLLLLSTICKPFNVLRTVLFILMCSGFVVAVLFFQNIFSLVSLTPTLFGILCLLMILATIIFSLVTFVFNDIHIKNNFLHE